ncbi:MAG: hypothetical protein CVV24_14535 [Ignavibacteriae bacterium HGW-Ignavibacteriae-3]|nr:MAG: hypothetical protein CVV24_14535 [Ignavibacteriae bacterium HGW-Ignavibacteriae-3]
MSHSCCEMMNEVSPMSCESPAGIDENTFSKCDCIHTMSQDNRDYTIQKSFELQKANNFAILFPNIDLECNSLNFHLKQRYEKEHGPPIFLLVSTFLI